MVGRPKLGSCVLRDRDSFNGRVFLPCSPGGPWQTSTPQLWRVWRCGGEALQILILQLGSRPRSAGSELKSWCECDFLAAPVVIFGGSSKP